MKRDWLAAACGAILAAITLLCLIEVGLRHGFRQGIGFYDELAGYLLVWLTFLGAVLARRDRAHIGIADLVDHRLGPRGRRAARIAEHVAMLALHLVIALFGAMHALPFMGERAITMPVPMGVFYLVLPLFAAMTAFIDGRRLSAELMTRNRS